MVADTEAQVRRSSRRARRRRKRRLIAAGITIALVAGIGGGGYLAYASLKQQAAELQANLTTDLQAGQSELEAGKASLTEANSKRDLGLVTQATNHFLAAASHFRTASQRADGSLVLRAAERLPAVGDQAYARHMAVTGISGMGMAIAQAGIDVAALDGQLINRPASGQQGRTVLTLISEIQPTLVKIRGDLTRAQTSAADVDVHVLPASQQAAFLKARDTISSGLGGLDEFDRLVPVLTEVLGNNGPRTYLIEQVNPAELRAGGGFIGTYSILRADHGTLTLLKSGNAYDLANPRPLPGKPGFIPIPSPLREIIPNVSWSFVDSNIYPDFPSNAKAALRFAQPRVKFKLDAVIAMDYYTVEKMLELTGPLAVPGYRTVNATTFIPQIIKADVSATSNYKAILAAIAGPLMQRVAALPASQWPTLIGALGALASQRHLQAYFVDATAQQEIERVGWSGSINPTASQDFVMDVESNYYGDKVNYFLQRQFTLVLTRNGGVLHHQVTIDLVNNEVCGSYPRTSYVANLRLYVGQGASTLSSNLFPIRFANPAPPSGTSLLDGWLPEVVCHGGRGHAVFSYDTQWQPTADGTYQIYWQKQPGTVDDQVDVTWNDGSGHTYTVGGSLSQDRVITLSSSSVTLTTGMPAQATLPSLGLG